MSKRPNISPSGWLSNLGAQPRQQKSLANRQQQWIKDHWWLTKAHWSTKITRKQWDEANELNVLHLLDTTNRARP